MPLTHRQQLTWLAWLELEWDRPSRSDQYLMANTAEVRRSWVSKPGDVDDRDFRLKFGTGEDKPGDRAGGPPPWLPVYRAREHAHLFAQAFVELNKKVMENK